MARGILEVPGGGMPKDDREWAQFLKQLNELIKIDGSTITVGVTPGTIELASIRSIPGHRILGNSAGGDSSVDALTTAQVAGLVGPEIDHGVLQGRGDDDHPQYVLVSALPTLAFGTYTPTLTGVSNVAFAGGGFTAQYLRIGNIVTVSGQMNVNATAATTLTEVGISLPIASALANTNECAGTANALVQYGVVSADAANDRAMLSFTAFDTATRGMFYQFTYRIL